MTVPQTIGRPLAGLATALMLCVGAACTSGADDTATADAETLDFEQPQAANPCEAANPCAAEANPCATETNPCAAETNPCAADANPCAAEAAEPPGRAPTAKVATTIAEFLKTDSGLKAYFDEAAGYAVFPSVGKAGFIVGGAHGKGELISHGSAVGTTEISEISVGLQAGGQEFSEIIFFKTDADIDRFKSGKTEFSSGFAAVAVVGGATNKPPYREGVVVMTRTKGGLMAEMSVGGQKFKFTSY
jgi:lipid-binding SYLF domain-containing protein